MKSLNSIIENSKQSQAVTDFLDSLDTDMTDSSENAEEVIQDETVCETDFQELDENKEEITALVVTKPNSLYIAQTMFKKSIKISIKSFLISLSLGFLNLFL